ncbi:MAG: GTPase ObgE [Bacteroidota bacterium]
MDTGNFIDAIHVWVRAGKGGAGAVHFRRERFIPRGGPDGGDGGKGGSVILVGNKHQSTLFHLRFQKHIIARNGQGGGKSHANGAHGQDIMIAVPLGTVVKDRENGTIIGEVLQDGQKLCIAHGGKGGLGNAHFKSATRQAPNFAQPGEQGEKRAITIELKLIADVGLVGQPNAGKSTLLATLSAAKPRIADYPFTTLVPSLGVVTYHEHSFTVADIPGLIQGASSGKGLGIRFLRHVERNKALLYMIPADDQNIQATYHMLRQELAIHNPLLSKKPHLLAITKADILSEPAKKIMLSQAPSGVPTLLISSITSFGISHLRKKLWQLIATI